MVKRTNVLFIRLTDDEKLKLQEYAKHYNLSLNMAIVKFIKSLENAEVENKWDIQVIEQR